MAGNVPTINALEQIDARLTKLTKPQHIALRRALGSDLDALKALPRVDVVGVTARLERLAAGIDTLPLEIDHQPNTLPKDHRQSRAAAQADAPLGRRLPTSCCTKPASWCGFAIWTSPKPCCCRQSVSSFCAKNVKLRLLDARLALMKGMEPAFTAMPMTP